MDDSRASLAVPDLDPHEKIAKIPCSNASSVTLPQVPNSSKEDALPSLASFTGQEEM